MSTFHIGTQNAASINNVGGDMVIEGGLHASASWRYELRGEIARAIDQLNGLPLPAHVQAEAGQALSEAAEATNGQPDKERAAGKLAKATTTLKEAGAFAGAGVTLLETIKRAASILGPIGATVLALL
jgi:hypothetical protein